MLEDKLTLFLQKNLNVLLIGRHGIGKTTIVKGITDKLGLKLKYYSASTLDPWADLVGIPVPDKKTGSLTFCRPKDLESAEFVFFDELNRAHPRVLNAILEIIQFKTINGNPLPNLRCVWAAINPPGEDYQVEELDPALVDRFHCYIRMEPEFNMQYMKTKMSEKVAKLVQLWWNEDCGEDHRKVLTPRRLEYLGTLIENKLPYTDALPPGHMFPVQDLVKKVNELETGEIGFNITKELILENPTLVKDKIKENPKLGIRATDIMARFNIKEIFASKDVIEVLPKDSISSICGLKFKDKRKEIVKMFKDQGIRTANYPKFSEVFFRDLQDELQ